MNMYAAKYYIVTKITVIKRERAIPKIPMNLEEKKETHQSLDLVALVPPITLRQCDVVDNKQKGLHRLLPSASQNASRRERREQLKLREEDICERWTRSSTICYMRMCIFLNFIHIRVCTFINCRGLNR